MDSKAQNAMWAAGGLAVGLLAPPVYRWFVCAAITACLGYTFQRYCSVQLRRRSLALRWSVRLTFAATLYVLLSYTWMPGWAFPYIPLALAPPALAFYGLWRFSPPEQPLIRT